MALTTLIASAQLVDAYIRQLAFSENISSDVKRRLLLSSAAWCLVSLFMYEKFFAEFGINAATYKAVLMLGWLPYFLIAVKFIPFSLPQHIFVLGMGAISSLIQHTIDATIILLNFPNMTTYQTIVADAASYLILFIIFLPILGRLFLKILPSQEFFNLRPLGIYIAILPLVIISAHLIRLADDVLVHSWAERLSRFYLPLVLFFFYRYILSAAKNFYDLQRLESNKQRLNEQLVALKEYNDRIQENQKLVAVMRHDLRHSYNLIYAMLESGNVAKAREHILTQELLLESTIEQTFCQSPTINSALSIYLRRAEKAGIKVFHKINLPPKLETDERNFALLLTNLLSNAIKASVTQKTSAREISLILQHTNEQCVLELSFRFDIQLPLDEDGLPLNSEENRGKDSLRQFIEIYNAFVDFSQHGDRVNLLMYWNDRFSEVKGI